MDLQELGEVFREERERQGLTIDEVVERTKISKINIVAIEKAQTEFLPHPVYAKGFVRNYARMLGLDADEMSAVMEVEYTLPELENGDGCGALNPPRIAVLNNEKKRTLRKVFLVVAVVVCLAAAGAYYFFGPKKAEQPVVATVEEPLAVEQSAPDGVEPEASEAVTESVPADQTESATEDVQANAAATAPADASGAESAAEPVADATPKESAPAEDVAAPEQTATVLPIAQQVLEVRATETCWMRAVIDPDENGEGKIIDATLQAGDSQVLNFATGLSLKLGNAGGVELMLNGQKYDFSAKRGQVRTLDFRAEE